MKHSALVFLSVIYIIFSPGSIFGQAMGVSIFGGAAFPQGDFGSTSADKAGYAKTGFCGAFEAGNDISTNFRWTASLLLSYNSMDETEMKNQLGSGWSVTAGSYLTTWGMIGGSIEFPVGSTNKIYVLGQGGLLVSAFPDVTLKYYTASVTQTTKTATAFAYGVGAGIMIEKVNIGLRYYMSEPEYEQTAGSSSIKQTLPASVLNIMVGIKL